MKSSSLVVTPDMHAEGINRQSAILCRGQVKALMKGGLCGAPTLTVSTRPPVEETMGTVP